MSATAAQQSEARVRGLPVNEVGVNLSGGEMRVVHHGRLVGPGVLFEVMRDRPLCIVRESQPADQLNNLLPD